MDLAHSLAPKDKWYLDQEAQWGICQLAEKAELQSWGEMPGYRESWAERMHLAAGKWQGRHSMRRPLQVWCRRPLHGQQEPEHKRRNRYGVCVWSSHVPIKGYVNSHGHARVLTMAT